jgi:16S rRNA (cytidine1402-2'-O)-methyltransferase
MGVLYLVATPIGNLEDMTYRGVRILGEVELIAAEDTRSARKLLAHYGIRAPKLTSYNEHNAARSTSPILSALDDGLDVAVISDAGMPGISDPGHDLVTAAIAAGHGVVPIPGASAVIAAVAASGLPSRRFSYLGFLPRQSGPRKRALTQAAASGDTLVIYESPHRVRATLRDALDALGDRRIAVGRELTKLHEEIWRGTLSDALEHFAQPRGEFTLVLEGVAPLVSPAAPDEISATIDALTDGGATTRDAVARLMADHLLSRRDAYRLWHERDARSE